jgi:hypothetical protein
MRLAQYSLFHHSTNLLLVSLPTDPPSASTSLAIDIMLGAGECALEGRGVGAKLVATDEDPLLDDSFPFPFNLFFAFNSLPA